MTEMRLATAILFFATAFSDAAFLAAQPPPPGTGIGSVERRIEDIRRRLTQSSAATAQQKELQVFADKYLTEAEAALRTGKQFQARQLADAADACRRPLDHLDHISTRKVPPPPPDRGGRAGPPESPQDRLRQIYFRLRLCDFFLRQIPPPAPARLLDLARQFYEQAMAAQQANNIAEAEEYAKASDDLTHALESLAQAAVP